jgi:hypothetical protein
MHRNALRDPQIQQMQKDKFSVMCLDVLFKESALGPVEHENNASMFHGLDALECTTRPTDPIGCKNTSSA